MPSVVEAMKSAKAKNGRLHFLGLVSWCLIFGGGGGGGGGPLALVDNAVHPLRSVMEVCTAILST